MFIIKNQSTDEIMEQVTTISDLNLLLEEYEYWDIPVHVIEVEV